VIAHATYDFVVFFKKWKDANDQIEYAESMSVQPFPNNIENEARLLIMDYVDTRIDPNVVYKAMKQCRVQSDEANVLFI
jgi:hypothetical protein